MEGDPSRFETLGRRLGFHIEEQNADRLIYVWRGARFPGALCLVIATLLLLLSGPIALAIWRRGFAGPAASLWYFPLMNLILFGVAVFLFSLKRTIVCDATKERLTLTKRSLFKTARLGFDYSEVRDLVITQDQVYDGYAVAGSSAAESYPATALRLRTHGGENVLIDRASQRRLRLLGEELSARLKKPLRDARPPQPH
jgi:hypothetical protein